jgi:hypothetical protein
LAGYATILGASWPFSKRRLARRVIDVGSTYMAILEQCRVFGFEELQTKSRSTIGHNVRDDGKILRFG